MITQKINGYTTLCFSDNGIGIEPANVKDKIFKLSHRFHTNDDRNGIGLYRIYNHIKDLGGTIEIASQLNKGTTSVSYTHLDVYKRQH